MTSHSSSHPDTLSYEQAGVNYDLIDPLKVAAQRAAAATATHLSGHGFTEVAASRGESAYVVDVGPFYLASIVECLGSKALVADEMAELTGQSYYAGIAQDTIAMSINDLITVGATPLVVQAYWAAGGSDWFGDKQRAKALVDGWKAACDTCGVAWGGGETPALAGIVEAGRIDLASSCTGIVNPKSRLSVGDHLQAGDAIVLLSSSGIHANGLSLARKLVERLPNGYMTPVEPGPVLRRGAARPDDALLARHRGPGRRRPHRALQRQHHRPRLAQAAAPSQALHATASHTVPPVPPVLKFIQQHAKHDDREAYSTLNMGAGFALFMPADQAAQACQIAEDLGIGACIAGTVEDGPKQLLIEPLNIRFGDDDLQLR